MSKSYIFTSNIPIELKEKMLSLFFHEEKKKAFAEGIKKYGQDPENTEVAEWGMAEYAEQLDKYPR